MKQFLRDLKDAGLVALCGLFMLPVSGALAIRLLIEESTSPKYKNLGLLLLLWASLGLLLGGIVGFLVRPAAPLIGQLPFENVISRGSDLSGLDA